MASNLLNGKAGFSTEMAIRFEKAFGVKAYSLMQAAFELAQARRREGEIELEVA